MVVIDVTTRAPVFRVLWFSFSIGKTVKTLQETYATSKSQNSVGHFMAWNEVDQTSLFQSDRYLTFPAVQDSTPVQPKHQAP
jgi:hypothetical protein